MDNIRSFLSDASRIFQPLGEGKSTKNLKEGTSTPPTSLAENEKIVKSGQKTTKTPDKIKTEMSKLFKKVADSFKFDNPSSVGKKAAAPPLSPLHMKFIEIVKNHENLSYDPETRILKLKGVEEPREIIFEKVGDKEMITIKSNSGESYYNSDNIEPALADQNQTSINWQNAPPEEKEEDYFSEFLDEVKDKFPELNNLCNILSNIPPRKDEDHMKALKTALMSELITVLKLRGEPGEPNLRIISEISKLKTFEDVQNYRANR